MSVDRLREPVSVLFVLPNYRAGGAERVMLTFLSQLDRTGFAPELTVLDGCGEFSDLVPSDVFVQDLGARRLRSALLPLLRTIWKRRPALIFSTHSYISVALLALRAALPRKTKILVREPNTPSKSLAEMSHGGILEIAYRALLRRADLTICLNSTAESEMRTTYRIPQSKLIRMPNPVAVRSLRTAADPMVREPGSGLRLIAAGRLSRSKGFDRLLRAMASLPDDARLTLYGEGPEDEALKEQASSLALGEKVCFAGFEQRLAPALAGADAVIVPSRWEGMPNIVLEALACGAPVVSTHEAGGVIDLAKDVKAGALKLVSSEEELAAVMAGLQVSHHTDVRPSLLPSEFEDGHVLEELGRIFDGVLFGPDSAS